MLKHNRALVVKVITLLLKFYNFTYLTFARSFTLWSHAHRVGTTFALDWSKAREARVKLVKIYYFPIYPLYLKQKGKG